MKAMLLIFLTVLFTVITNAEAITIGETNVLSDADNGNGNLLVAQSTTLSQTATPTPTPTPSPGGPEPLPSRKVNLDARDFGIVGDGKRNNSTGLINLRNRMLSNRSVHYIVYFPPGTYRYTNNRWLMGVGWVTINGYGAKFQNTQSGNQNNFPFNTNSIWQEQGDVPWPDNLSYNTGYRIQSASKGQTVVKLMTASNISNFSVGKRVLIHGFDQQWGGYPPNLRYFEYSKVTSVNTSTGEIGLARSLINSYDPSWPDTTYDASLGLIVGAPRIMSLERPKFYFANYIEFQGVEILNNTTSIREAVGNPVAAEHLIFKDSKISATWFWPTENRFAIYENTEIGPSDVDKIVGRIEIRGCLLKDGLDSATGVNEMLIDNSTIRGNLAISPRKAVVSNNTFDMSYGDPHGALRSFVDSWPVLDFQFINNHIVNSSRLDYLVGGGATRKFTVSGTDGANSILLNNTATNRDETIRQIAPGTPIQRDGSSTTYTITSVGWTGLQWRLRGTWTQAISAGQVWNFKNIQEMKASGTTFDGVSVPVYGSSWPSQTSP